MKLIVQIPCYNEAETLARVIAEIPRQVRGFDEVEVIVIDDGSADDTSQVARDAGADLVLRHRRNRGLAASFNTGIRAAIRSGADVIVNTDGDNQYPGHRIPELVEPIVLGVSDVVIGDRQPETDRRQPLAKRVLYMIGRRTIGVFLGFTVNDPVCGFRAYSRETALKMQLVTSFSHTIETLILIADHGWSITNVRFKANRVLRQSRLFRSWRQFIVQSGLTLLRTAFMVRPLQILSGVAMLIAMPGFLAIIRFLYFFASGDGRGHVQSLVLGTGVLLVAGMIMVAALLADLIAHNRRLLLRCLEQTETGKDRTPKYPPSQMARTSA